MGGEFNWDEFKCPLTEVQSVSPLSPILAVLLFIFTRSLAKFLQEWFLKYQD